MSVFLRIFAQMNAPADITAMLRPRPVDAHKGSMGHALLVVGSRGMAGAALLSARACLRSGVGKLTVLTPECNRLILQLGVPEAIVAAEGLTDGSSLASFQAIGMGPGMGQSEEALQTLSKVLRQATTPVVLDADALNLLAAHEELWERVPRESILTPHPGEVSRLTGQWTNRQDCILHCYRLAQSHGVTVICKGAKTAICQSDGQVVQNETGNAGMATAGAGDVLTGIITGLLARGYEPREAARLGVWLHGAAGDLAANRLGQESLIAGDIVDHLGGAFKLVSK